MSLQLSVDYYNSEEARLFQSYEKYDQINQLIGQGFTISEDELKSHLLFTEQADDDGWRTYQDFKAKVESRKSFIDDYLDFSDGSVKARYVPKRLNDAGMTERVGVSLGINVINQIHNLTEADWIKTEDIYINGKRVKDFDYEIPMASDGKRFIQIENKGCVVDNNNYKRPSVCHQYSSIKDKKESILSRGNSQNIYYGTIGVLDNHNQAKVWLVDPDAYNIELNPRKFKLISRLIYYLNVFKEIGIHKSIIISLENRIELILQSNDFEQLDRNPLESKINWTYIQSYNFASVNYNEAFGSFFFIKNSEDIQVFMIALPKALINLVLSQNFDGILNYDYQNDEINDNVTIGLETKQNRASEEFEDENLGFVLDEKRKRYFLQSFQHISHTNSGRIFGTINIR